MRAEAVKIGRRTNLAACFALARPYLDGFEHDGTLNAVAMTIRGEPAFGTRFNRATTLYPVGPRTRSWAFEYRERSRCGIETTSSRRCSFGVEGTATPIESCRGGPGHCPSGPALSLGVSFRSRRVNQ